MKASHPNLCIVVLVVYPKWREKWREAAVNLTLTVEHHAVKVSLTAVNFTFTVEHHPVKVSVTAVNFTLSAVK